MDLPQQSRIEQFPPGPQPIARMAITGPREAERVEASKVKEGKLITDNDEAS